MKPSNKQFRLAAALALLIGGVIGIGTQTAAHAAPAPALPLPTKLPAQFTLPGGVQCRTQTNIVGRVYGIDCGSNSLLGLSVLRAPGDAALPPGVFGGVGSEPIQIRCNLDSQTCHGGGHVLVRLPSNTPPAFASAASEEHGHVRYVLDCRLPPTHGALDCDVSMLETAH
jgi:hypothetical protein